MCYTVIVITQICAHGHPTGGRVCWRQCREQAFLSQKHNEWNTRCTERLESDALVPIMEENQQVIHPGSCRTCQNLLRIVTNSQANDLLIKEQTKERGLRQLMEDLVEENASLEYSGNEQDLQRMDGNIEQLKELQEEVDMSVVTCDELQTTLLSTSDEIMTEGFRYVKDQIVSLSRNSDFELRFYYGSQDCTKEKEERSSQNDWPMCFPP